MVKGIEKGADNQLNIQIKMCINLSKDTIRIIEKSEYYEKVASVIEELSLLIREYEEALYFGEPEWFLLSFAIEIIQLSTTLNTKITEAMIKGKKDRNTENEKLIAKIQERMFILKREFN